MRLIRLNYVDVPSYYCEPELILYVQNELKDINQYMIITHKETIYYSFLSFY
jgi:hypothetical protein